MELPADRATLAVLGREWLLHGHLQDRLGMALVMEHLGREDMQDVAVEEWMSASPVYSRRMQETMDFVGDGVDTILKNLQLDIGAPHEFMDFRFRLDDRQHGEFWLAHCGALMDVEPMGEEFVHGMCHAIEDPTFDATAGATNPAAQVRPLHRPPRRPAGRMPHCHWRVDIVPGDALVTPHPNQAIVEQSLLARLPVRRPVPGPAGDGRSDYHGEFDPDLRLEDFSVDALQVACREFAIQSHLLLRGLLLAVTQRLGAATARAITPRLLAGWGGLTAQRLRDAFSLTADADGLAAMLRLHPMLHPADYVGASVSVEDDRSVRLSFGDGVGLAEADQMTWLSGLGGSTDRALEHIVAAFEPRARLRRVDRSAGAGFSYLAVIDPETAPADEPPELAIAKISTGAAFRFGRPTARLLPAADRLV